MSRYEDRMLVVKSRCGNEIRRIPILNLEITYDELCFMMHRLFRHKLSAKVDNLILKYEDEDGDMVSLTDDVDVQHAVSLSKVLKITVYDKDLLPEEDVGQVLSNQIQDIEISQKNVICKALEDIQEKITTILSALKVEVTKNEVVKEVSVPPVVTPVAPVQTTKVLKAEELKVTRSTSSSPIVNSTVKTENAIPPSSSVPSTSPQKLSSIDAMFPLTTTAPSNESKSQASVPVNSSASVNASVPPANASVPLVNSSMPPVNPSMPPVNSSMPPVNPSMPPVNPSLPNQQPQMNQQSMPPQTNQQSMPPQMNPQMNQQPQMFSMPQGMYAPPPPQYFNQQQQPYYNPSGPNTQGPYYPPNPNRPPPQQPPYNRYQ